MSQDTYDHCNPQHRIELAAAIITKVVMGCAFEEEFPAGVKERVFSRRVKDRLRIVVYTTIEGRQVREVGEDSIRVCAVYTSKDGTERGVAKATKRVHRVGEFEAIVDRVHQRMREVWALAVHSEVCPDCGAPMFTTKKKTLCCADLCWKKVVTPSTQNPSQPYVWRGRGRNRPYWNAQP